MARNETSFAKGLVRPRFVRIALSALFSLTVYDTIASQLELPTIRRLFGMSGPLLPWWGWLIILQTIFIAALFEYVRRNIPAAPTKLTADNEIVKVHADTELNNSVKLLEARFAQIKDRVDPNIAAVVQAISRQAYLKHKLGELAAYRATLTGLRGHLDQFRGLTDAKIQEMPITANRIVNSRQQIPKALKDVAEWAKSSFNADLDLTQFPNYTLNQLQAVEGDDEVSDKFRQEYRRLVDMFDTAAVKIAAFEQRLKNEIKLRENDLVQAGSGAS